MRIKRMETVLIGIIGLLVGVGATLGTQQALKGDQDRTEDVLKAIKDLESEIDKAEAQATKNQCYLQHNQQQVYRRAMYEALE